MKNFAAKLFLMVVVVSGLSTLALASGNAALNSISGTIVRYFTVGAFDTNTHSIYLEAGKIVYVRATGDESTDLDMYVTDASDELIVSDERSSTDGYVKFTPQYAGYYYIDIDNTGAEDNYYKLVVTF